MIVEIIMTFFFQDVRIYILKSSLRSYWDDLVIFHIRSLNLLVTNKILHLPLGLDYTRGCVFTTVHIFNSQMQITVEDKQ